MAQVKIKDVWHHVWNVKKFDNTDSIKSFSIRLEGKTANVEYKERDNTLGGVIAIVGGGIAGFVIGGPLGAIGGVGGGILETILERGGEYINLDSGEVVLSHLISAENGDYFKKF